MRKLFLIALAAIAILAPLKASAEHDDGSLDLGALTVTVRPVGVPSCMGGNLNRQQIRLPNGGCVDGPPIRQAQYGGHHPGYGYGHHPRHHGGYGHHPQRRQGYHPHQRYGYGHHPHHGHAQSYGHRRGSQETYHRQTVTRGFVMKNNWHRRCINGHCVCLSGICR